MVFFCWERDSDRERERERERTWDNSAQGQSASASPAIRRRTCGDQVCWQRGQCECCRMWEEEGGRGPALKRRVEAMGESGMMERKRIPKKKNRQRKARRSEKTRQKKYAFPNWGWDLGPFLRFHLALSRRSSGTGTKRQLVYAMNGIMGYLLVCACCACCACCMQSVKSMNSGRLQRKTSPFRP